MKKRPVSRSRPVASPSSGWASVFVIVLLACLVALTAVDVYFDHFIPQEEQSITEVLETEADPAEVEEPPILIARGIQQTEPESREKPSPTAPLPKDVKVQVLNGCGVRGIAARIRGVLRERGFDVMSFGNAKRQNYAESQIIIRSRGVFGDQAADILAESLGITPDQISRVEDASLVDINLTVVIGSDYTQLNLSME